MDIETSIVTKKYESISLSQFCHISISFDRATFGKVQTIEGTTKFIEDQSVTFSYGKNLSKFIDVITNTLDSLLRKSEYCSSTYLCDKKVRIEADASKKPFFSILTLCDDGHWNTVIDFSHRKDLINFLSKLKSVFLYGIWIDIDKHDITNAFLMILEEKSIDDPEDFFELSRSSQKEISKIIVERLSLKFEKVNYTLSLLINYIDWISTYNSLSLGISLHQENQQDENVGSKRKSDIDTNEKKKKKSVSKETTASNIQSKETTYDPNSSISENDKREKSSKERDKVINLANTSSSKESDQPNIGSRETTDESAAHNTINGNFREERSERNECQASSSAPKKSGVNCEDTNVQLLLHNKEPMLQDPQNNSFSDQTIKNVQIPNQAYLPQLFQGDQTVQFCNDNNQQSIILPPITMQNSTAHIQTVHFVKTINNAYQNPPKTIHLSEPGSELPMLSTELFGGQIFES